MVERLVNRDARGKTCTFGGIPIVGFAPGTYINIVTEVDQFNTIVGVDGEAVRTKTNNKAGYVEFTLLETSLSNDALTAVHQVDLNTPNGDGISILEVKDLYGLDGAFAEEAWIVKFPDSAYADTPQNRTWRIYSHNLQRYVGGNV
jgi:hypothetical protein